MRSISIYYQPMDAPFLRMSYCRPLEFLHYQANPLLSRHISSKDLPSPRGQGGIFLDKWRGFGIGMARFDTPQGLAQQAATPVCCVSLVLRRSTYEKVRLRL